MNKFLVGLVMAQCFALGYFVSIKVHTTAPVDQTVQSQKTLDICKKFWSDYLDSSELNHE